MIYVKVPKGTNGSAAAALRAETCNPLIAIMTFLC